ncbi:MAG: hypothetical protein JRN39_07810 [Nitrososphaerota archaeon]|nr:hypothetical protein [Nitrososphaerota archaeon]
MPPADDGETIRDPPAPREPEFRFFARHPVLLLVLLTPGIPEYLSGSSPVTSLILNPPLFLVQLLLNVCLYGPGVLLVREAAVRWRKGWATIILLLGCAYGILEEGVALNTLFYSKANPVGALGFYGHWLGVNWVWSAGVLMVHMVLSVSLPIMLLGVALPATRGRSLLPGRRAGAALALLTGDVFALLVFTVRYAGFWMGQPIFILSLAAIVCVVYAARRVPATLLSPAGRQRPYWAVAVLGALFFPLILLAEFLPMKASLPAPAALIALLAAEGLLFRAVRGSVGREKDERRLVALSAGVLAPICLFGFLSQAHLPLVLLADAAILLFLARLWRMYPPPDIIK